MNKELNRIVDSKENVKKAGLLLTDVTNGGVKLPIEVADSFILKAIRQPNLLSLMRVERVRNPQTRFTKINHTPWVLYPKAEGTDATAGQTTKSTFEYVDILPQRMSAYTTISTEALEDNASGPGGLMRDAETQFIRRLNENILQYILEADTTFTDGDANKQATMRLTDGLIKLAANNPTTSLVNPVVDASGAFDATTPTIKNILKEMRKAMLPQYRSSVLTDYAYVMNDNDATDLRDIISKRQTILGDSFHNGVSNFQVDGIPVIGSSFIPQGTVLLTKPNNMIFAPHIYDMRMAKWYDPDLDINKLKVHLYMGFQWEELDAVVYQNLADNTPTP